MTCHGYYHFNPHTHEGCDKDSRRWYLHPWVSIHTPTKGVTSVTRASTRVPRWFQSTHPRRVWQHGAVGRIHLHQFQSTHPRRVWQSMLGRCWCWWCFNPHTHEGCDLTERRRVHGESVSIHTPTKGVTQPIGSYRYNLEFQSTHPRRVWPVWGSRGFVLFRVSIHTPTKGVTLLTFARASTYFCFNPHTHEGCDMRLLLTTNTTTVSIHTPTKGVTFPPVIISL